MEKVERGYNDKQSWGDLPRIEMPPVIEPRYVDDYGEPYGPLIVACVCVGPKFPAYYVERLRNMVDRHCSYEYTFECITDRDDLHDYAYCRKPPRDLPGWYSKINLFHPGTFPVGSRVLYFDLDVIITGSIDPFFQARNPFCMIREFSTTNGMANNSSVMAWTAGDETLEINEQFEDDWMRKSWGDQECIWTIMGNERIWNWEPSTVCSYKYHGPDVPENCRVMVFHGDPKACALDHNWIKEHWC